MVRLLYRWAYILCVYTGIRAAFNRLRSWLDRGETPVSRLHRARIRPGGLGRMNVFVHSRPRPRSTQRAAHFGMISVRQERPSVGRILYRYLCLTSHFGCGHVEVAFYEAGGQVTFYAVRNTARSNAARVGWGDVSERLGAPGEDVRILRTLTLKLERVGLSARFAPASECVELAVNRRLIDPRSLRRTTAALEKKYRRLPRTIVRHRPGIR